ncbi:Peptidase S24-like [Catalinimonas alkaloidigena]|uniref:Peptidase S24-like n=1 Tax=Catalinimonas alkaloidigena TaxID=1075417 RepID=A0A1G9BCQ4_9BACT|nr:S24 family peptidase [Catalinimonas alkaloidigena]SDK37271.1 Peptidase S24-like [Catalinimonas alkaloidigena]
MNQAERLATLRKQTGLTQREAGSRVGVSHSRINVYEKDSNVRIKVPVLRKLAALYGTTPEYIETGEKKVNQPLNKMPPRVIVLDPTETRENILFVPVKAQAGYPRLLNDPSFIRDLQTFSIPGFTNGTYRIFEVAGDSMQPIIQPGDLLICEHIESLEEIKDGDIYVIVSTEGILVKRCINAVRKRGAVIIESENPEYKPDVVMAADILEVWRYKAKITRN